MLYKYIYYTHILYIIRIYTHRSINKRLILVKTSYITFCFEIYALPSNMPHLYHYNAVLSSHDGTDLSKSYLNSELVLNAIQQSSWRIKR